MSKTILELRVIDLGEKQVVHVVEVAESVLTQSTYQQNMSMFLHFIDTREI